MKRKTKKLLAQALRAVFKDVLTSVSKGISTTVDRAQDQLSDVLVFYKRRKRRKLWPLKLLLAGVFVFGVERFCHKQTDGFSLDRITVSPAPAQQGALPYHIEAVLEQPFKYLGKGAQCYAFESQDGHFVLKLLRQDRFGPVSFLERLFSRLSSSQLKQSARQEKRAAKRSKTLESCQLAFHELKNETGLLYLHFNGGERVNKTITIFDKSGVMHKIKLDHTEFMFQKRAKPLYSTFEAWMRAGQEETAKHALTRLVSLLKRRCDKGIDDKDPDLKTNFGFIGEDPIQFDVGRFSRIKKKQDPEELIRITAHLKTWLEERYPSLAAHLTALVFPKESEYAHF